MAAGKNVPPRRRRTLPTEIIAFILSLFVFAGCDQTFNPLQENDRYFFSIYGSLDAAADTQWVRVGPARQDIDELPDPAGIRVILEPLHADTSVLMNDSLFTPDNFLNYWTTFNIEKAQTYRITVERNGKSSQVTVTTPSELPTPRVLDGHDPATGKRTTTVYIDDTIEHLADVQSKWYVLLHYDGQSERVIHSYSHRNKVKRTDSFGGSYFVDIITDDVEAAVKQRHAGTDIDIVYKQIYIASGGPEWDDNLSSIGDLEYFLNKVTSNVESGLGYVVGIDSKWIPFKTCEAHGGAVIVPCEDEEPYWRGVPNE